MSYGPFAVLFRGGFWASVCAVLLMIGCSKKEAPKMTAPTTTVPVKEAPTTPMTAKKAELGGTTWDPAWDAIVEAALHRRCWAA